VAQASAELDRIRELRSRISHMQRMRLETKTIGTLDAFAPLFPDGALHAGAAYSVAASMSLVMGLLAGPSGAGEWCGVVGVPEFGIEAAARLGVDLERLVLIPHPGDQWLGVTAALADALGVVVTRPAGRVSDADAARLGARLRQRGSTLIALGDWPRSETRLTVTESTWSGLGAGHGYPAARRMTIAASGRGGSGPVRRAQVWLPDENETIRAAGHAAERAHSPSERVLKAVPARAAG
jgi:hypothetical protein